MEKALQDIFDKAETWPAEAQEEFAEMAREMDKSLKSGTYHPTPEEWIGINRGLEDARAGRFATDEEVQKIFSKHRPA